MSTFSSSIFKKHVSQAGRNGKFKTSCLKNKREVNINNVKVAGQTITNNNLMNVKIFGKTISTVIDTGADISVISTKLLEEIPRLKRIKLKQSQYDCIKLPNDQQLSILGVMSVPVLFDNCLIHMKVHLVKNLNTNFIVGMDFLRTNKARINLANQKLFIRPNLGMRPNQKYVIPAKSECIILARIRGSLPDGIIGTTPNIKSLSYLGIATARVLATTQDNLVPIRLINSSDHDVTLKKNANLGKFTPLPNGTTLSEFHDETMTDTPTRNTTTSKEQDEFFELFNFDDEESDLSSDQIQQLRNLLWENKNAFVDKNNKLGYCDIIKHRIELEPNARPTPRAPYKVSPEKREEIRRQLDDLLDQGIIKHSVSPFSAPVLLVKKPSGKWRLVIDYRDLNKQTIPIVYPLPAVTDCLDMIGSQAPKYFTTLDMTSGFWQIALNKQDYHKTAFVSHDGKFEFTTLPQGLRNSSASFQQTMQFIFRNLIWKYVMIYIDDIIIFSKTFQDHLHHIDIVLKRLIEANLKLGPQKCVFGKKQVKFLGHILNENGISTDPKKVDAISTFPVPKNVSQLRSFLGCAGYYRRFIRNFSKIASPLHKLLLKDAAFKWDEN